MNAESNLITEVHQLADAYFDGNLDVAGVARLEELIDHNIDCLHAYVERLDFHGELLNLGDPHSNEQAAVLVLQEITDARVVHAAQSHRRFLVVSTAAAMIVCGFLGWLVWGGGFQSKPLGNIAHMTEDATSPDRTLELGQLIRGGNIVSIESGVLSIRLTNVIVDLLGPAQLKLNSTRQVELLNGALTAHVSKGGEGFTVQTADAEVTDFGTVFSVRYEKELGTEVSVRQGRVQSKLLDRDRVPQKVLDMTAERSAIFSQSNASVREVNYIPEHFEKVERTRGAVLSITGNARTLTTPPPELARGALQTRDHLLVIPERLNVVLNDDLVLNGLSGPVTLPSGTRVSSYLIHYDPDNLATKAPRGSVTFDGEVAAVLVQAEQLARTDSQLGIPDSTYPTEDSRGLELQEEEIRISDDRRTVSFYFTATGTNPLDQMRILVVQ